MLSITLQVFVKFKYISPQLKGRSLKDFDGKTKANSLDIKVNEKLESHVILNDKNKLDFYFSEGDEIQKLKVLFMYDPKTKKFIKKH